MKINEAKGKILDFFVQKISQDYSDDFTITDGKSENVFWSRSRTDNPQKPYIILNDTKIFKLNKRVESFCKNNIEYLKKQTSLKVTFRIYTLISGEDAASAEAFSMELAEYIQDLFGGMPSVFDELNDLGISVKETENSEIRDLSTINSSDNEIIKEVDVTFGFEDIREFTPDLGKDLEMNIQVKS